MVQRASEEDQQRSWTASDRSPCSGWWNPNLPDHDNERFCLLTAFLAVSNANRP